jgi:hypothetical protein
MPVAQFIRIQSLTGVQAVNNEQKGYGRKDLWGNKRCGFEIIILQEIIVTSIKIVSLSSACVNGADCMQR